ncbi:MAG: sulfatase [Kiritimatiellia bacterium]|jgi:arylsulfatase A-like enzyme|nr:sulfatase [Kiritimatiellia bacterium]
MRKLDRRSFIKTLGAGAAALCWPLLSFADDKSPGKSRPNVLFIAIDDLRPELGCYGSKHIKSPHIDALAKRGIIFDRAYCQTPVCGPSRASLLTGIRPDKRTCNIWNADKFAPNAVTLPQAFRQAGYHTISNSKIFHGPQQAAGRSWSETPTGHDNHMDTFDPASKKFFKGKRGPFFEAPDAPDEKYVDGQTCAKSLKDLRRLAKMDKPFFLGVGFIRPHLPFYAPKKYWDMYKQKDIAIAENRFKPKKAPASLRASREVHSYHDRDIKYNSLEFHRIARHGYYACVSYVDALVGKLLATLDELKLRDNTIVVIWGDHGWHLGEHNFWAKTNLLHNATHAPLIISAPGFQGNIRTGRIVELVDIYPTLCELAGVKPPEHLEGASMAPLMKNPKRQWKEAAFTRHGNGSTVTTRDYTYTEYGNGAQRMLYDRKKDPSENENVAEAEEYKETVDRLSKLLSESQKKAQA